jgi:hypothetical protein
MGSATGIDPANFALESGPCIQSIWAEENDIDHDTTDEIEKSVHELLKQEVETIDQYYREGKYNVNREDCIIL